MNTTAAALQAKVTVPTVRIWCRRNVIAAVKVAGRWIVDAASLAHRIAIGHKPMTEQPTYTVQTGTSPYGSTAYTVVRSDGTPAGWGSGKDQRVAHISTFSKIQDAELVAEFLSRTPHEYRISKDSYRANSMRRGSFWKVTGGLNDDPSDLRQTWDYDQQVSGNWPEGTRPVDILVHWALQHADGAPARIQAKAEKAVIAAAEQAVQQGRDDHLAALRAQKGELATARQVDYILNLLEQRRISGEGGGFFQGPTDKAGIEELSKNEASMYIRSLKGDY